MKLTAIATRKKRTTTPVHVHFDGYSDGQAIVSQVVDFVRKRICPLIQNLAVKLEGTLPGKA
jgi:hypothetical protein